jgi:predicted dehydrogenase
MLKVAFVDHHLNNYHADTFLKLMRGELVGENAEVVTAWESDPTGDDWCVKNNISRAASLKEAVRAADAVLLLAPDNIEAHPALADAVLSVGKPVFFDKLLAPDLNSAREIAKMAKRYNTPLFSASALRFAAELEKVPKHSGKPNEATARGMGQWDRYGVHTLSLVSALMGQGVRRVIDTGTATARTVTLDYGGGRRAIVDCRTAANEWEVFPWSFALHLPGSDRAFAATITDYNAFYANLLRHVLAFFRTRNAPVGVEGLLETVAVLEAADRSLKRQGEWIPIDL